MIRVLLIVVLSCAVAGCQTSEITRAATLPSGPARLSIDFNDPNPSPSFAASASSSSVITQASRQPVGTIDLAGTSTPSGGILFTADSSETTGAWRADLVSGPIAVSISETDLSKLTLAFMLSSSSALPVTVRIESLDATGKSTGGLDGVVYPAAPDFYQRYALDLSTLKSFGPGKFDPSASAIRLTFGLSRTADGRGWAAAKHELRLDNVSYSGPAFYVSTKGKDTNDGRTEATAFATPQAAVNAAGPGDIILLRAGTYNGGDLPAVDFVRAGTPAAWIVLKNYPGERPVLKGNGWNIVSIHRGSKEAKSSAPALAYLEVRGLNVRGDADTLEKTHPELLNKPVARINTNGIAIDGRYEANPPHHIRFADNLIEWAPGQGVGSLEADWVTIEHNISRENCHTTIYATSGISTLGASNFDSTQGVYKMLIRDNVSNGNETRYKWAAIKKYSDGNGIILDVNISPTDRKGINYLGRTLVQGNLVYDNGGSGIHCVTSAHIDIINNTAYYNSASPNLEYGAIFASWGSNDVRIINNIMVARVANIAAGEKPEPLNPGSGKPTNIIYSHNLYFGGNIPPKLGEGDRFADPQFVHPSINPAVADFRLKPGSPAIGAGATESYAPYLDLDRHPRATPPSLGAYEAPSKN